MLTREQKAAFVESSAKKLDRYSTVAIVSMDRVPDRLLQKSRNSMRGDATFIMGRRTLLARILERSDSLKPLVKELSATSAIVLSNKDPFELNGMFRANTLQLAAKPNQMATDAIEIKAGETSVQPGQAVTELKQAGIDVKIDKGKVVIAKDKVLVEKGAVVTTSVAKALKTLGVMPFTASIAPSLITDKRLMFTPAVLGMTPEIVSADVSEAFAQALALSRATGMVNSYTITDMLADAYHNAVGLGIGARIYDTGITESLLAEAAADASTLGTKIGQ